MTTGTEASEGFFNTDGVEPEGETVQPQPAKPPVDDGGPAFPVYGVNRFGQVSISGGATLRDYFAAAALQGMMGNNEVNTWKTLDGDSITTYATASKAAYQIADAMLRARQS